MQCQECGSSVLRYDVIITSKPGGLVQGRLKMQDLQVLAVLRCDECSATVQTLNADEIAEQLTDLVREGR
jgi:DNA-directed RNA polymerase subunit RPC12/RpoP